jgi:hypothetical protein
MADPFLWWLTSIWPRLELSEPYVMVMDPQAAYRGWRAWARMLRCDVCLVDNLAHQDWQRWLWQVQALVIAPHGSRKLPILTRAEWLRASWGMRLVSGGRAALVEEAGLLDAMHTGRVHRAWLASVWAGSLFPWEEYGRVELAGQYHPAQADALGEAFPWEFAGCDLAKRDKDSKL